MNSRDLNNELGIWIEWFVIQIPRTMVVRIQITIVLIDQYSNHHGTMVLDI